MSNILMKGAIRVVTPYLGKISDGLDAMAKEFGVNECFLMIRTKMIPSEKNPSVLEKKPMLVFMAAENGSLVTLKDKKGKLAEYPIEKLVELISGGSIEEDEDESDD
jgi:hypothetical protein